MKVSVPKLQLGNEEEIGPCPLRGGPRSRSQLDQRALVRTARHVADIPGDGVAGQARPRCLDELRADGLGDFKMGGAGDPVQLVKVIGHDAVVDKPLKNAPAASTLSLTPRSSTLWLSRGCRRRQPRDRRRGRLVDLRRMVHVQDEDDSQPGGAATTRLGVTVGESTPAGGCAPAAGGPGIAAIWPAMRASRGSSSIGDR